MRDRLDKSLIIRSSCRRPEHKRAVGSATRSKQMEGTAFDVAMANHAPVEFGEAAPTREVLDESRIIKGGGAATVETLGAAGRRRPWTIKAQTRAYL